MKRSTMLGTTSEHALRALTCMAALPDGSAVLGRDLAQTADIPANYLSKILWSLGNAGIIDATRGSGGGYRLKKRPEQIRLVEVVELFDKSHGKTGCLLGGQDCSEENACAAHNAWREVRGAYNNFLESTTIADIASHGRAPSKKRRRSGENR